VAGIERRIMNVVAQLASIAALNLRNAVLLKRVQDLAERDSLTGAANRYSFQASLKRVLDEGQEPDRISAVLFIDLDDFKIVNDSLGHAAGDELLVAVTRRISSLVRDDDLVARLGGDEFAVLTHDQPDLRRSRAMAERLVRDLRAPYLVAGKPVSISASIGIAGARDAIDGAGDMVRNADVAMYMAKAGGKAGFAIFDPGMHQAIRERHELALELKQAVDLEQLVLRYQPIIDLATNRLAGVEALVRWRHPERGLIPPGQFIEIAEEAGSILPIGRWVLREACRQAAAWGAEGSTPADMFVGVNVSAREVQEQGFIDGVREALSDHGVAASRLVIEITETALLRATPTTVETLQDLRDLGVRVVIDDFGTGYFSLSHLRQFPVDALKIAGEFTQEGESATATRSSALAAAIVAMARSLGIDTVAEGIETPAQAERMRSLRCTYGQGFHFAHPLLAEEIPVAALGIEASLAEAAAEAEVMAEMEAERATTPRSRRRATARRTGQPAATRAASA
jgi:diguanylate cyclase (GGDEF)-like protein